MNSVERNSDDVRGTDGIAHWPATRLAAAIRARELSSGELLERYLDRIESLDGSVNSVVTVAVERAMAEALAADKDAAHGDWRGPLHGLPITVKDAIETEGIRSTGGAHELASHVPRHDALAVARLKQAGAIVFGKSNVPRWSGDMQSYNEVFGTTRNPWNLDRTPGGSSGGAAAAVACGFTSFELGTDIGGSIRIPAHLCGVFGLRPSYGVVPQNGYLAGIRPNMSPLDINVFGPLTRSADDMDILLDVLSGPDPLHGRGWALELPPARSKTLADYRIGLWLDDEFCPVESEYLQLIRGTVDLLAEQGARLSDEHPLVDFEESFTTYWSLMMAANGLNAPTDDQPERTLSHPAWLAADDLRAKQRTTWEEWFASGFDILICPVLATGAFNHDHAGDYSKRFVLVNGEQRSHNEIARWNGLTGALGLPATVVPIARTAEGLPVGIQVIAPFLHDRDAINVARLIADVVGYFTAPQGY